MQGTIKAQRSAAQSLPARAASMPQFMGRIQDRADDDGSLRQTGGGATVPAVTRFRSRKETP